MEDLKEELKTQLTEMKYGEIRVVAMVDRGAYPDEVTGGGAVSVDEIDATTGASKALMSGVAKLAEGLLAPDEDLISVQREEKNKAMQQVDVDYFLSALTADKHVIFLQCLDLGTTEIKNFLYALKDSGMLANSKVFLLDLPQLEYMMLRDSLRGKIEI